MNNNFALHFIYIFLLSFYCQNFQVGREIIKNEELEVFMNRIVLTVPAVPKASSHSKNTNANCIQN
jgi:hypothetical protein